MMLSQSRLASQEVLRKYMNERVPVEKRVEGVYVPTILTDNVCFLLEDTRDFFKENRIREANGVLKRVNNIIRSYRAKNITAMHDRQFAAIKRSSVQFYNNCIYPHLMIDQQTYTNELWKQRPLYPSYLVNVLGMVYFTKMVLLYIIQYERIWTNEIQNYLGPDVRYVARDNETCTALLKCVDDILDVYKAPATLNNNNIQLTYNIFHEKVKQIDTTSVLKEK